MSQRPSHVRLLDSAPTAGDDASLVQAAMTGAKGDVTALFDRCAPLLRGMLLRVLGPDPELPDLLHDAFLRLMGSLHQLDDPRALPGFATRIAAYTALEVLRRRRRQRWLRFFAPEELNEPELPGLDEESREALRRFERLLGRVSPEERMAFSLRVVSGLGLDDIAQACDCSVATIKRRIARAERVLVPLLAADPLLGRFVSEGTRWGGDA